MAIIAVDFDGTCVTHAFPEIGQEIGAAPILKKLAACGHKIILWTMRSYGQKNPTVLADAVTWFQDRDIPLWGVNMNPDQMAWSASPKAHANLYIDDLALGVPLYKPGKGARPYVDWLKVDRMLQEMGYYNVDLNNSSADTASKFTDTDRLNYLLQFIRVDDVGDEEYCKGIVVNGDSLEEKVGYGPMVNGRMEGTVKEWEDGLRDVIDRSMVAHNFKNKFVPATNRAGEGAESEIENAAKSSPVH
jgi:hypothetical protein